MGAFFLYDSNRKDEVDLFSIKKVFCIKKSYFNHCIKKISVYNKHVN